MCVENAEEGSVCLVELHASGEEVEEEEDRGRGSKGWRGWGGCYQPIYPSHHAKRESEQIWSGKNRYQAA